MKTLMALLALFSVNASAAEYRCTVTRKLDTERDYTKADLERGKYTNLIEETEEGTYISRCSFSPSQGKVTCDRYKADRVDVDPYVKIKKMYVFRSQFSVQIFPTLTFIEDNGRGSISFGKCELTAP